MSVFYALWTPARTPDDIQRRLAVALQRIVGAPDFQARLKLEGAMGPVTSTPAESRAFSERETRRSEEHTSELQSLMRISYAVLCLKQKKKKEERRKKK